MFLAGFIQKTVKEDQFVKLNHVFPRRKQLQKVLEDTRRYSTEAGSEQAGRSPGPPASLQLRTSVLHYLKDCISIIYSSRFDPRAQD